MYLLCKSLLKQDIVLTSKKGIIRIKRIITDRLNHRQQKKFEVLLMFEFLFFQMVSCYLERKKQQQQKSKLLLLCLLVHVFFNLLYCLTLLQFVYWTLNDTVPPSIQGLLFKVWLYFALCTESLIVLCTLFLHLHFLYSIESYVCYVRLLCTVHFIPSCPFKSMSVIRLACNDWGQDGQWECFTFYLCTFDHYLGM